MIPLGSSQPLLLRHLRKMALGQQELFESPAFHNPAMIQNNDLIHVGQSGEAVGDADYCPTLLKGIDGPLDFRLCVGIQSGGRFIQN